jgi:hypothetical protein
MAQARARGGNDRVLDGRADDVGGRAAGGTEIAMNSVSSEGTWRMRAGL